MQMITIEPYLPESLKVGDYKEIRIENIYDPSKFWIVIKFRELETFMELIRRFYERVRNRLEMPDEMITPGAICVVRRNKLYYRAVINGLLNRTLEHKIKLFLIDYGLFVTEKRSEIFRIDEKFMKVPRFSVRAILANVCPLDSRNFWSSSDTKVFQNLVEKRRMFAKICLIDKERKILHVALRELCGHFCHYINDIMVSTRAAKFLFDKGNEEEDVKILRNLKPKVKHLYLYPSFEVLECGKLPTSLKEFNVLQSCMLLDVLYKDYLEYKKTI